MNGAHEGAYNAPNHKLPHRSGGLAWAVPAEQGDRSLARDILFEPAYSR